MTFVPNPNFESEFNRRVQRVAGAMVGRLQATLDNFCREHAGEDVDTVRPALADAWASTNQGAHIGEPALTKAAQGVNQGKCIWIDPGGHIMVGTWEERARADI